MATGRQNKLVGQTGEYLVASELSRRGLIATTFTGNVPHYDIIASTEKGKHIIEEIEKSDSEFIEKILKLKKSARKFDNKICYVVDNGNFKLKFYDKLNPKSKTPQFILSDSIKFKDLDIRNTFSQSKDLVI